MADRLILDGSNSLELSARGAGSDIRSWARDQVGEVGSRLFLNNHQGPGDVDTVINRNRGNVDIGRSESGAKLNVQAGGSQPAVMARAGNGDAVRGESSSGHGVSGVSFTHTGTEGGSDSGIGVHGLSSGGTGVRGESNSGPGVVAMSIQGINVLEARVVNNLVFSVRRDGAVLADGPFTGPADFAEMLPAAGVAEDYEAGDVLAVGKDGKLRLAAEPETTAVAGVYSDRPGFVGDTRIRRDGIAQQPEDPPNAVATDGVTWVALALLGVVPVKVTAENGPISPGDLLVSALTPGHAMKALPIRLDGREIYPTGAVIGKALEPLRSGRGRIKALVTQH
jgi:hypothetical protein